MKVIFLDIDGVLDVFNREEYIQVLREDALLRLKKLVDKTDARIVVISGWRYGSPWYTDRLQEKQRFPQECDNWPVLVKAFREWKLEVYDVTPWEESLPTRSEEIMKYLEEHPEIERYVILDDCFGDDYSQCPELRQKLVFVDANRALQDCDVEKALGML